MFKKSITFKIAFGFIVIVIISTLILGTISISLFENNIYQIKRNNMEKHAVEISYIIEPYIISGTYSEEYQNILKVIDSFTNSKVWVITQDGRILAASKNKNDMNSYINNNEVITAYKKLIEKALSGSNGYGEIYNPYYREYMITVAVPIRYSDGSVRGAILLHSSTADLANSMDSFFIYILIALFGEIILAGFMGYYFSKNISKPIKIINDSALKMASGKYGIKTNIYQSDEIGELSNSFDILSLKLEHTIGKLFEEKTKLSNIITSMNEGIIAFDIDFNTININQSALGLLEMENISEETDTLSVLESIGIIDELKVTISRGEKKSVIKKLNEKALNFSLSPISSSSNEIIGIVILIQDISQKEKLEQMRKDFIANVSHEFRTPLTVIRGNLESIIDGITDTQDIIDRCRTLLIETTRLERMVRDLLDLSKLESGRVDLDLQDIDVNSVMKDTLRGFKHILNSKNIAVDLELQDNIPPVLSDYDKLKQLFIIFLDNAIKFSDKDSKIEIVTCCKDDFLNIKIKDHGPGIPEGALEYLGERFYKVDKSRNTNVTGTGLGLSIAKNIVKVLNGDFKIESKLGKGTEINIIIRINKV